MKEEFIVRSSFNKSDYLDNVSNMTASEYILRKVQKAVDNGKTDLIIDGVTGESIQYCNFEDFTKRIGSSLYKRGMRKGDTAIYMTYDLLYIHTFLCGVWRANGIARASYPEEDEETLLDRVEESRAGWILCDPEASKMCLSVASKIYWDVEVIVVGDAEGCTSLSELFEDDGTELPKLNVTQDDIALILCTSGTTGKSKGAVHSHWSMLNILEPVKYLPFTADKPNLMLSKATHVTGTIFPLACFCAGKTCLVMANISKDNLFKAVDTYKPGFIWGFPTFILMLVNDPDAVNYDTSSLEVVVSGGAPVTPAIEKTLMKLPGLKSVINCYGLTEVLPLACEIDLANPEPAKIPGTPAFTVGGVFPGVEMKIRDPETGQTLGPNERGEICVKTNGLFRSYYKRPDATADAFIDGWFLTGDAGYIDERGFLYLVDRMKEIFKYYNNHISPTELEDVISKHSAVAEVCVIGVPDPDGGDHIPRAFVTIRHEAAESDMTELSQEIQEFANGKLPNYKHLRGGVYIVPDLPKGKTGKITRQLVAKLAVN